MVRIEALDVIFDPQRHYEKLETKATNLTTEQLQAELNKYKHRLRNTAIVTTLATAAASATDVIIASHFGGTAAGLSAGPLAFGASYIGITRNIIRRGEQETLKEEIAKRPQPNVFKVE